MPKKKMTERQQHWLNHLKSAEAGNTSLTEYAKAHNLKVKDLYQWKSYLIKLGHWKSAEPGFVAVKTPQSIPVCSLIFPNGLRLQFEGSLSSEMINSLVTSASSLS